jgi:RNA polymerase sigma factor (sigma-70 family)
MPAGKLTHLMSRLGQGDSNGMRSAADGELLTLFVAERNEEAFAELVYRHSGLVFGVCRRVTGNHHLAEDAFQAVFVVLAAKAAAVRPPHAVAAWLHGVAWRTASRARTMADRRRRREVVVSALPEPIPRSPEEMPDAVAVLDEEIARLPAHYRLPLVMCELQGQSRKEVAGRLGIPEGTLSSRLAHARKVIANRLRQRGIALSVAGLTAVLTQAASGQAPVALAANVTAAATRGTIPAHVTKLSHGVLRIMFLDKLKTTIPLAVLVAGLVACAAIAAVPRSQPPEPPQILPTPPVILAAKRTDPPPAKTAPEKPIPEGRILVYNQGKRLFLTPDGKPDGEFPGPTDKTNPFYKARDFALSPDGKRVAFITYDVNPRDREGNNVRYVLIRDLDGKDTGTNLELKVHNMAWTSDGKLLVVEVESSKALRERKFTTWLVDVATKEKTRLDLPDSAHAFSMTPDGKAFLASTDDAVDKNKLNLSLVGREDKKVTHLIEMGRQSGDLFQLPRLSREGSKVLYLDMDREEKLEKDMVRWPRLFVFNLKTQKRERLEDTPLNGFIYSFAWSPDSRRVAYSWKRLEPGVPLATTINANGTFDDTKANTETESHLTVADANGKNAKTVLSAKAKNSPTVTIWEMDWR